MNLKTYVLALVFLLVAPFAAADESVPPVPAPDLSKLPAAQAEQLRRARDSFEHARAALTGDALSETYVVLGSAYVRNGFLDEAAVAFDDAARLAPQNGRWVYAQGLVARARKRNAEADAYFKRAFALTPNYLPIRVILASSQLEKGDLEGARKLLADFIAWSTSEALPYAMLGDIALRQKRYAEAIEHFNQALKLAPSATKVYAQLADAYAGAGDAKAAAEARAKAGDGAPPMADPVMLGMLNLTAPGAAKPPEPAADPLAKKSAEAAFALASGQFDAARQRLDEALKLKPNDPVLLAMYARADAGLGDLSRARARADAAVAAGPRNAEALLSLGLVLEMSNDEDGAQRTYEKALSMDPKLTEPQIRLGNLFMRHARYDDAAARYRAATQADPADGEAWARLVAAQVVGGKCAAALSEVNAGLAKDAKKGFLLQLFVRLASTCAATGVEEKKMALDYAAKMYRESPAAPQIGEAYAVALAANGKWDGAVQIQQAAMFPLVRAGAKANLPPYQEFLQQFRAHKLPDRPWPASSPLFNPQRPAPAPPKASSTAAPQK